MAVQPTAPPTYHINGFNFPLLCEPNVVEEALTYQARADDIFVVTYPKCGTTWTQQIVSLLLNNGDIEESRREEGLWSLSPFLEMAGKRVAENIQRPNAIKTHLPKRLQPWNDQAKYLMVIRNPKDVCVSYYHHLLLLPTGYKAVATDIHGFVPLFLSGRLGYQSYFDWYLSWWPFKDHKNVLVLVYEEIKEDPQRQIYRIADFLGLGLREKLDDESADLMNRILKNSSLSHMKKVTNETMRQLAVKRGEQVPEKYEFVRKGIVGDYKNHLNDCDEQAIEAKVSEKFGGTGLDRIWDKYGIFSH